MAYFMYFPIMRQSLSMFNEDPVNSKSALVQEMAWHRSGDMPSHVSILTISDSNSPLCKSRRCHAQVINGSLHVLSIIEFVQKDQMNNYFSQHWFREWLGTDQATSHHLYQSLTKAIDLYVNPDNVTHRTLPLIYLVMCFNEDWRYPFTLANSFCLLELI